jgi:hypothetical protein
VSTPVLKPCDEAQVFCTHYRHQRICISGCIADIVGAPAARHPTRRAADAAVYAMRRCLSERL